MGTGLRDRGHFTDLVLHLTKREVAAKHRLTLLGWAWPLVRQLVQLAVLVFVFSRLFDIGQDNYAVFLFVGLIVFAWFSSAMTDGASSLLSQRHLVSQPRFPSAVVPVIAVAVPFVDLLLALPVMIGMLVVVGELAPSALLVVPLIAIQFVLMCGLAWALAAASVYLRDVPNIVMVGTLLLFYLTPVFYSYETLNARGVGTELTTALELNPLGVLIEAHRAVLLGDPGPTVLAVAQVAALSAALAALGLILFRRLEPRFVDEL